MMRVASVLVVLVVALLGVTACSSSGTPKTRPPQAPIDYRGRTHVDVAAQDNLFTPPNIVITVGTTVTWHNTGAVAHDVKKPSDLLDFGGKFGVDVDKFGPGASYSFKFTKAGVFQYLCTIHALMTGTVAVNATAPATTTTRP